MKKAKNYVGMTIGKFKILEQYSKDYKVYLKTKCIKCGKIAIVSQNHVKDRKCCESNSAATQFKALEASQHEIINNIEILEKSYKKSGHWFWKCKCLCGNIFYAQLSDIKSGKIKSCGCYKRKSINSDIREKGMKAYAEKYLKDGTNLAAISRKTLSNNNTSGVTGVTYVAKKDKWIAQLWFKNNHYSKTFDTKEEAIKYRKELEEKYFKPILDKYKEQN